MSLTVILSLLALLAAFLAGRRSGSSTVLNPDTHEQLKKSVQTNLDQSVAVAKENAENAGNKPNALSDYLNTKRSNTHSKL